MGHSPMPTSEISRLTHLILRHRLASQQQVEDALQEFGKAVTPTGLLELLESRGVLTSYQAGKLAKGDTEGLLLGKYKLMYRNAAGSFARVFRACDVDTGQMVGLKLLRNRWAKDPAAVQQFRREAELGQTLKHENIVPIFEIGNEGNQHYFTMEFVEGGNLLEWIGIRKKLQPVEALKCLTDVTSGLNYAHSRGLMHRDLKLSNILMSAQGVAKLVDFGLADAHQARERTGSDGTQRTLDYATLEKNTSAPRDDPRSDIFFLGVIFYELLTGEPPLPRTRDRDVRGDFVNYRMIRPIRQADPAIPHAICEIVDRMLQLSPQSRYQTTSDLLADLRAAQASLPPPSTDPRSLSSYVAPNSRATELAARLTPLESEQPTVPAKTVTPISAFTVLCVESRVKQQDMLREYFTRHKFRVLMMSDPLRALSRVKSNPPDALILVADGLDEECITVFSSIQKSLGTHPCACLVVLSSKQAQWAAAFQPRLSDRVLMQPVSLRDLRQTIRSIRRGDTDEGSSANQLDDT